MLVTPLINVAFRAVRCQQCHCFVMMMTEASAEICQAVSFGIRHVASSAIRYRTRRLINCRGVTMRRKVTPAWWLSAIRGCLLCGLSAEMPLVASVRSYRAVGYHAIPAMLMTAWRETAETDARRLATTLADAISGTGVSVARLLIYDGVTTLGGSRKPRLIANHYRSKTINVAVRLKRRLGMTVGC